MQSIQQMWLWVIGSISTHFRNLSQQFLVMMKSSSESTTSLIVYHSFPHGTFEYAMQFQIVQITFNQKLYITDNNSNIAWCRQVPFFLSELNWIFLERICWVSFHYSWQIFALSWFLQANFFQCNPLFENFLSWKRGANYNPGSLIQVVTEHWYLVRFILVTLF